MGSPEINPDKKDLASLYPEIAAQWDLEKNGDLTPDQVLPGSGKRIYWTCEEGHSWRTAVYHRTEGHGCPVCAGAIILAGHNDLATLYPELMDEWGEEIERITVHDEKYVVEFKSGIEIDVRI